MSDEQIDVVYFIIGTSPFIIIYPWLYLYHAYSKLSLHEKDESVISFETLTLLLPLLFGFGIPLMNRLLELLVPRKIEFLNRYIYLRYIVAGTLTSLLISLLFHYVFHIQDKWLRLENPNISHIIVTVFYFIVFIFIGSWLRSHILYGSSNNMIVPKSSSQPSSAQSSPMPLNMLPKEKIFDMLAKKNEIK